MQNRAIEIFYLLFQGALVFQVLIFGVLYFFTKKKDILYYSLFLLFAAVYFFVNAPYTFFDIPEKTVWASSWYDHVNTPLIIVENLFYLLFLKAFFYDVTTDKSVVRGLLITVRIIPFLIALFILLSVLQVNSQSIFYTVNMISVVPAAAVAYIILKRKIPFASLVANGLICTIAGTSVTVYMIVLGNNGVHKLFTVGYPLFFIRLGILGDMIFYLAAILKKWHLQEKQFAVEKIQSLIHERLRISRELHDDIGSTLGSISIYSEVARNRSQKNENADEAISKIGVASRELIEKISDIVWSINPNNESFEQLQNRMQAFAAMILTPRNIYYDFKADEATKKINLTSEQRKIFS
jgi:signal transduction histidine kinase